MIDNSEQPIVDSKESKSGGNSALALYPLDTNSYKIKINIFPNLEKPMFVTHTLRKPTFDEEEARERKMPLVTSDAGKIDGFDATSMVMDDESANVYLYDKIVTGVEGYALRPGEKAKEGEVSPDEDVDGVTVKELIPASHKSTAVAGMFPSSFEIDTDDGEFTFALGGGREWRLKQEIGGKARREDGTLSPAEYTIFYTFKEPSEAQRKKFRGEAVIATNLRTKKGIEERRSTNLRVLKDLFDGLILSIEAATINGKEIDVRDKADRKSVV